MTCYPVYIPTLNRYEHIRNYVELLERGWSGKGCETMRFSKFMPWARK